MLCSRIGVGCRFFVSFQIDALVSSFDADFWLIFCTVHLVWPSCCQSCAYQPVRGQWSRQLVLSHIFAHLSQIRYLPTLGHFLQHVLSLSNSTYGVRSTSMLLPIFLILTLHLQSLSLIFLFPRFFSFNFNELLHLIETLPSNSLSLLASYIFNIVIIQLPISIRHLEDQIWMV